MDEERRHAYLKSADNWVANIGLGTLREQLQHVAAV
jgi:hypothetical protein